MCIHLYFYIHYHHYQKCIRFTDSIKTIPSDHAKIHAFGALKDVCYAHAAKKEQKTPIINIVNA